MVNAVRIKVRGWLAVNNEYKGGRNWLTYLQQARAPLQIELL